MNRNTTTTASALFSPKVIFGLVIAWIVAVALGSAIAIGTTQSALMSDEEVDALLSENERLAQTANVAHTERVYTEVAQPLNPAFPEHLYIPKLGTELPVSNPQTRNIEALDAELKSAVVRYPDAATLGEQGGNTLIFGHSSRLPIVRNPLYKAFNDIETLEVGDIVKATSGQDVYTYHVTRVYEADASGDSIPLNIEGHRLTLLTCDSFGTRSDRFVVEAEFIGKNI